MLKAQRLAGEIRLEVRDPSGAGMEASGKLQNLASGVVRTFQTDDKGVYALLPLPSARYRLEVARNGFATRALLIDVYSPAPIVRTVTMLLGTASAQVDVVAATPLPGGDLSCG